MSASTMNSAPRLAIWAEIRSKLCNAGCTVSGISEVYLPSSVTFSVASPSFRAVMAFPSSVAASPSSAKLYAPPYPAGKGKTVQSSAFSVYTSPTSIPSVVLPFRLMGYGFSGSAAQNLSS